MKHYIKPDGSLWAFPDDGSQDAQVALDMTPISGAALDAARRALLPAPSVPRAVSIRQAFRALRAAGLLDQVTAGVEAAIAAMPSPQRDDARIDWERATEWRRDDPLLLQLAPGLGLDAAALDALFVAAADL